VRAPEGRLGLAEGDDDLAPEGEMRIAQPDATGAPQAPYRGILLGERAPGVPERKRRPGRAAGSTSLQLLGRNVARQAGFGQRAVAALLERRDRRERLRDRFAGIAGAARRRDLAVVGDVESRAFDHPIEALALEAVELLDRCAERALPRRERLEEVRREARARAPPARPAAGEVLREARQPPLPPPHPPLP